MTHHSKYGTMAIKIMKEHHINKVHGGDKDILVEVFQEANGYIVVGEDTEEDYKMCLKEMSKPVLDALYTDTRFDTTYEKITVGNRKIRMRVYQVKDEYWI